MLADLVQEYLKLFPDDKQQLQGLLQQIADDDRLDDSQNFTGHATGAGVVLSPDKLQILLIHHKLLDKWLQPGGHWEPEDKTPLDVARREVQEETGLESLTLVLIDAAHPEVPFDIDSHFIATPRPPQLPHWHHDFRYVFIATDTELTPEMTEVHAAGWFALDDPITSDVQKIIQKLQQTGIIA